MILKTELPQICSCQEQQFSNKPKNMPLTRIYRQLKIYHQQQQISHHLFLCQKKTSFWQNQHPTNKKLASSNRALQWSLAVAAQRQWQLQQHLRQQSGSGRVAAVRRQHWRWWWRRWQQSGHSSGGGSSAVTVASTVLQRGVCGCSSSAGTAWWEAQMHLGSCGGGG
jgi:hypothetical protein